MVLGQARNTVAHCTCIARQPLPTAPLLCHTLVPIPFQMHTYVDLVPVHMFTHFKNTTSCPLDFLIMSSRDFLLLWTHLPLIHQEFKDSVVS